MAGATATVIDWVEQGLVPDLVVRQGIRALLAQRLAALPRDCEAAMAHKQAFIARMDASPIALVPELANEQHYEVPAEFFAAALGPRRKYSACWWPQGVADLAAAEEASLAVTAERAGLADGQRVLDLGCGWGSFSLWAAEHYPASQITAVSNSASQRAFIEGRARELGLANLTVVTADMNHFEPAGTFDRVVSIEMFEHMRNQRALIARIHDWLVPGGRLFIHVFCHREHPYEFEDQGPSDWMTRRFFAGGIMPSDDLLPHFQDHLRLTGRWRWDGRHYERTLNAWLARMDARRTEIRPIMEATYGNRDWETWWRRWRVFFMACAELFGYRGGQEWWVGHYRFERPGG